jgi:hypothetical protein
MSGTSFQASFGSLILHAFQLVGLRPTSLVQEHFESARMAANLMLLHWANDGVNLWRVDLATIPLTQGQSTYDVDPDTVTILDAYYTIGSDAHAIDRVMLPISRSEYSAYANKEQQGAPTVFWHNRQLVPTVTLWPVPDGIEGTFSFYRLVQNETATMTDGASPQIPQIWYPAFVTGLAGQLAVIWAPEKVQLLAPLATEAYNKAAATNVELAQQYISPMIAGYFRN